MKKFIFCYFCHYLFLIFITPGKHQASFFTFSLLSNLHWIGVFIFHKFGRFIHKVTFSSITQIHPSEGFLVDRNAWRNGFCHCMTGSAMCPVMPHHGGRNAPVTAGRSSGPQLETARPIICQTKTFNFIWQTLLSSINNLRFRHHRNTKVMRCKCK